MAGKKKKKKQPTLLSLIVTLIAEEGPRKLSGMTRILGSSTLKLNKNGGTLGNARIQHSDVMCDCTF